MAARLSTITQPAEGLPQRILVVSSYPPTHCGIAAYAAQQVEALRRQGHEVTVASLDGRGDADLHFCLVEPAEIARLSRIVPRYDRTILHYQSGFFFRSLRKRELWVKNVLLAELFRQGVEVVCHELDDARLTRALGRINMALEHAKWRAARKIVVHTSVEAENLRRLLPGLPIELREHHADFVRRWSLDREVTRDRFGVPRDAKVFLCIGFLQPHKGFDRAIDAFAGIDDPSARLYIVGSTRLDDAPVVDYVALLRRLAALDPRVSLIERFVSDEIFDGWITAADAVLIPYREIWSSGVVARSRLLDRPVIAADVGGVPAQLGPGDMIFRDDRELENCLRAAAGGKPGPKRASPRGDDLRIAAVVPWYGADVEGGAETIFRGVVERLAGRGAQVEVHTTAVRGYASDWAVDARPAHEIVGGIPVHRYPVEPRDVVPYEAANAKICRGEQPTSEELRAFETQMLRCPGLSVAVARRSRQVDLVMLGSYMFQPTFEAAAACAGNAVLVPCLHDEPYARLPAYRRMFREARGLLFKSAPERDLAQRLYGVDPERCAVVGDGLDMDWVVAPDAFSRRRHADRRFGLHGFFLYVGRKEEGKGFPLLIERFRAYRRKRPEAKLALVGPGQFQPDAADGGSIVDFGFLPEPEKREALAAAIALIQPSRLEAFSLTLMESWLARRPAIVHGGCAVTRGHVEACGGGLCFEAQDEFDAACDRLRDDPEQAWRMGIAGRRYVTTRYTWDAVIDRYLEALAHFRSLAGTARIALSG